MVLTGIFLATLSGICNGLFTAPMRVERRWRWENIWFGFIVVACLLMPAAIVFSSVRNLGDIFASAPAGCYCAVGFGFAWGFGAICFGLSVDNLGVSIANSLVIGLSSALGSLVPIILAGNLSLKPQEVTLFGGVLVFLIGVWLCGRAGRLRDAAPAAAGNFSPKGYLLAIAAGIMSAVFNIGYALALPIADAGVRLGHSRFEATNCIWLLMLAAGAVPNIVYCWVLMLRSGSVRLLSTPPLGRSVAIVASMGLLWGGSIFLYGAATPRLGSIGPSIGWPLSLAVGLLVANLMGVLLGEWRGAGSKAATTMNVGILTLLCAITLCAVSTRMSR